MSFYAVFSEAPSASWSADTFSPSTLAASFVMRTLLRLTRIRTVRSRSSSFISAQLATRERV